MITKLFIGGIVPGTDEMSLALLIAPYGDMATMKLVRDKKTGKFKGYAFVEMVSREAADHVIDALDGKMVNGNELTVNIVEEQTAAPAPAHKRLFKQTSAVRTKRPRIKR